MKIKITRIKPPKYYVGRYALNEYELRCLMAEVCAGEKEAGIVVYDGTTHAKILPNGRLSKNLKGMDISANYTIALLRAQRQRRIMIME